MDIQKVASILEQYPDNWNIITILNGGFSYKYSQILSDGLIVKTSEECKDSELFFGFVEDNEKRGKSITFKTELLADNDIYMELVAETKLNVPIIFLHISDIGTQDSIVKYKIFFHSGENSIADIYEVQETINNNRYSVYQIFSASISKKSNINYIRMSNSPYLQQVNMDYVCLYENSQMNWYDFTLNAEQIRERKYFSLLGENSILNAMSFSLLTDNNIIDKQTEIHHSAHSSTSNQLVKTIVEGSGKSFFDGKIVVDKNATGTNAKQFSRGVLLNTTAEIFFLPQLEINNDDVICSHGSAIGSFGTDLLFYLNSRGIEKTTAEQLLIQAFAEEIIEKISVNKFIIEKIKTLIFEQLKLKLN